MVKQRRDMIKLFDVYSELFDRTLGKVPGKPVSLTLKPDAVPFCSCLHTIPMAIQKIAHEKVQKLCNAHVLRCSSSSPWGSPCLFQGKKKRGIQFLTNLQKSNKSILCSPYPLPNIDDTIWKMQGFTYAMCRDLNCGYYHFALDQFAQQLCAIVLLWGKYKKLCLPQGLMVSSDIFQGKMDTLFQFFNDVLIFINNIILYTDQSFEHHHD
eukprot:837541-Ditylum_brightwellii.AAC.1